MFSLSPETLKVLHLLNKAGFEAYLVGGCVRDFLLGKTPQDIDITTNALPEEIKDVFSDYRTVDTGIRHGTVSVILADQSFEVTTYRVDVGYSDGRHPDAVRFSRSYYEDAARRDFTVNAMAYHPQTGVLDHFNGMEDLRTHVIRCVGEPNRRFTEDALRILRALRFAATLGFSIDPQTAKALLAQKDLLVRVSAERVTAEFSKLLCGTDIDRIWENYLPILTAYLPELPQSHRADIGRILKQLPPMLHLRLAAILCKLSSTQIDLLLHRLRFDNKTVQAALAICSVLREKISRDRPTLRRLIGRHSAHTVTDACSLLAITCAAEANAQGAVEAQCAGKLVEEIIAAGDCCTIGQLAIGGQELIALGLKGSAIGQMLSHLLFEVTGDNIENKRESLLTEVSHKIHTPIV